MGPKSPPNPLKIAFLAAVTFFLIYSGSLYFLSRKVDWLLVVAETIIFFIVYYMAQWLLNKKRAKSRKRKPRKKKSKSKKGLAKRRK